MTSPHLPTTFISALQQACHEYCVMMIETMCIFATRPLSSLSENVIKEKTAHELVKCNAEILVNPTRDNKL